MVFYHKLEKIDNFTPPLRIGLKDINDLCKTKTDELLLIELTCLPIRNNHVFSNSSSMLASLSDLPRAVKL